MTLPRFAIRDSSLGPTTVNPDPASRMTLPVARNPDRVGAGTDHVTASDPHPAAPMVGPVAGDPDMAGRGSHGDDFHLCRRGLFRHDDFIARPRRVIRVVDDDHAADAARDDGDP